MITIKDRALTPNIQAMERLSHVLARLSDSLIIVHGGGSFGHYWSVKYDMHTRARIVSFSGNFSGTSNLW